MSIHYDIKNAVIVSGVDFHLSSDLRMYSQARALAVRRGIYSLWFKDSDDFQRCLKNSCEAATRHVMNRTFRCHQRNDVTTREGIYENTIGKIFPSNVAGINHRQAIAFHSGEKRIEIKTMLPERVNRK